MQLDIQTRHFNLGDDQKEMIAASCDKLERFSPRPIVEIKIMLTHESGRFAADAVLYLRNAEFRASGEGMEPELAIGEVTESLRKQLSKFKGKISGRQKGEEGGLGRAMVADEPVTEDGVAQLTSDRFELRDMGVEEAVQLFRGSEQAFLVFRNIATSRVCVVYQRSDGEVGLLESTTA